MSSLRFFSFALFAIVIGVQASRDTHDDVRNGGAHNAIGEHLYRDVIVLGGGSSGTYTAIQLNQLSNLSVALIEKENRLGGHVNTYTVPGTNKTYDYGVQVFDNTSTTLEYFAHFDIPLYIPDYSDGGSGGPSLIADFASATPLTSAPAAQGNFTAAILKYKQILSEKYPYLRAGNGFHDIPYPVPEELLLPWSDFIRKHELEDLAYPVWQYNQGVGDILNLPTLYMLKYLNNDESQSFLTGYLRNQYEDNQLLYDRALAELQPNVFLSSNVTSIVRHHEGVELCVSTPSGEIVIHARKLVIAVPPKLSILDPFLDMTQHERNLFGQFTNDYYWDSLLRNSGIPDNTTISNIDPSAPWSIPATNPGMYGIGATGIPGLHSVYYSSSEYLSNVQVQENILQTTAELVRAYNFSTSGTPEFAAFAAHVPFELQVSADAIRSGFYERLLRLQGKRNTWYVGAAWETQNSIAIWENVRYGVLPGLLASLE